MNGEKTSGGQAPVCWIVSLDQFRGYTVAGMLLVNFVGGYAVVPEIFKHRQTFCSYADTIMPQFFFAVGFAFRLTFLRRLAGGDHWLAIRAVLKRNAGLILLGFVFHHLTGKVNSWLSWKKWDFGYSIIPLRFVVNRSKCGPDRAHVDLDPSGHRLGNDLVFFCDRSGRAPPLVVVAILLQLGVEYAGHRWRTARFLTWTVPMLVGSLAYDAVAKARACGNPSQRC